MLQIAEIEQIKLYKSATKSENLDKIKPLVFSKKIERDN
jgi:hypothetical protein